MAENNVYGDRLIPNSGTHGNDIASQRLDDLDRGALRDVLSFVDARTTCVDLGCGAGWQGVRFAVLGATVHLFDLLPEPALIRELRNHTSLSMSYYSCDLRDIKPEELPERVDLAYSQRFIHYLRYAEAEAFVRTVAERMAPRARFYLSASGLHSELGIGYSAAGAPLDTRFAPLSMEMQSRHAIREPVCLYSEHDMSSLMTRNGFIECRIWKSAFGNIKGVFEKAG